MSRRTLILGTLVIAVAALWYLFRPERLFIDKTVDESISSAITAAADEGSVDGGSVTALLNGTFHSNAHETKGTATIYRRADGGRFLRLEDFATSNGPDVQIYLVAASDVNDNETVSKAGFVSLGAMKGNIGDQNYEVPADVDLTRYRAVTVWCRRFSVNFGTAPLAVTGM